MSLEIQSAANFITELIRISNQDISKNTLNRLNSHLVNELQHKFSHFWHPERPYAGSGLRCIRINDRLDNIIDLACKAVGLCPNAIYASLKNKSLILWIDPGQVSFKIHEETCILYENDLLPWQPRKTREKKLERGKMRKKKCIEYIKSFLVNS